MTDEQVVRALYERLVQTFARARVESYVAGPPTTTVTLKDLPPNLSLIRDGRAWAAADYFNTFAESKEGEEYRDHPDFMTGRISIRGVVRKIERQGPGVNEITIKARDPDDPDETGPFSFMDKGREEEFEPEEGEYVYWGMNLNKTVNAEDFNFGTYTGAFPCIRLDSGKCSEIDDTGWPRGRFIARNRQIYLLPDDEADQAIPVPGLPIGAKILPRIEAETLPIEPEQLSLNPMGPQRRRFLFVASAVVGLSSARQPGRSAAGGQFEAQKIAEKIAERFPVGYGLRPESQGSEYEGEVGKWPYYDVGPDPDRRIGHYYGPSDTEVSGLWVRARPQIGPGFALTDANEWRLPVTIRLETLRP